MDTERQREKSKEKKNWEIVRIYIYPNILKFECYILGYYEESKKKVCEENMLKKAENEREELQNIIENIQRKW